MKYLTTIIVVTLLFTSCEKTTEEIIGIQNNTIQLSTRELNFDSPAAEKEVTTKGNQWCIDLITNEDKKLDYSVEDLIIIRGSIAQYDSTPITIESDWFVITRELKRIKVKVKQNTSSQERIVKICVNDRNYFDRIVVKQYGSTK